MRRAAFDLEKLNGQLIQALTTALAHDPELAAAVVPLAQPRARRVSLRVDPVAQTIVLVWPRGMSPKSAARFVSQKRSWIMRRRAAMPTRIPFQDGVVVPFRGADHVIRHVAEGRGGVWREGSVIYVSGHPEHIGRRVTDWLKAEAKRMLQPMALAMAAAIPRPVARVTVRDTRSRWGSCSADGKLSFCWRLILAPDWVLTYVAAHEVAHLKHLNHGRAFWATLNEVWSAYFAGCPDAPKTMDLKTVRSAREWLRRSGTALHSYG